MPIECTDLAARTHRALMVYGPLLPGPVRELLRDLAQSVDALTKAVHDIEKEIQK